MSYERLGASSGPTSGARSISAQPCAQGEGRWPGQVTAVYGRDVQRLERRR